MPIINNPAVCNADLLTIIREKLNDTAFTHQEWSCNELLPVRTFFRQHYRAEQNGLCAYCQNDISVRSANNAHVEHIAPKSIYRKFMFEAKNLCVICSDCNEIKSDKEVLNHYTDTVKPLQGNASRSQYPRSTNAFFIVHPHYDEWDDHLIKFGHQYISKTNKGAFTIFVCNLNRYFHQKYNTIQEFVSDDDLIGKMKAFIEAGSSVQRTRILLDLKNDMSRLI
jgi:hypothetical protein